MSLIFAREFNDELNIENIKEHFAYHLFHFAQTDEYEQLSPEFDEKFIVEEVEGVFRNCKEIDGLIAEHAVGWSLARISKVDLAIMRLAVYESVFAPKINEKISINEAIELAKMYSTNESPKFINGVLGGVVRAKAAKGAADDS